MKKPMKQWMMAGAVYIALCRGALGLDESDLQEAIRSRIPEKFHALNLKALSWANP